MRWYLLAAVVFGLSITDEASRAQGPPAGQRLSSSRPTLQHAGYFATSGVVRFQMIQGRLCLDPPRHRKGSQSRDQDGIYESITVTAERGIPSLHYVCQTPEQELTLSVEQATHVRIESRCRLTQQRSVLIQPHVGPVRWSLLHAEREQQRSGATLLHLRQCDPVGFDIHHGRLIERLLRGRSFDDISRATQQLLIRHAAACEVPDAASVYAAVDALRAPRRAARYEAHRRLVGWGTPVIPILNQIDRDRLEPEQIARIESIVGSLRTRESDRPATLAMLLINDRNYWSLLAPDLSGNELRLANDHLTRSGMKPLPAGVGTTERIAAATE